MGIEPTEPPLGDHCPMCFPAGESPDTILVFISGVTYNNIAFPGLPAAPNEYVYCHKTAIACEYKGMGDKAWRVFVLWHVAFSQITVEVPGPVFAFVEAPAAQCVKHFTNARQNPAIFAYTGGFAFVTTPDRMLEYIELAVSVVGPDPRMELEAMENDQVVLRFASRHDSTNIKFRIDV